MARSSILLAAALAAGCAQQQPRTEDSFPRAQQDAPAISREREEQARRDCLQHTGTHVSRPHGQCLGETGHVVSREELLRTGSPDAATALRRTMPSLR